MSIYATTEAGIRKLASHHLSDLGRPTADDLAALTMGEAVPATAFIDQEGHIAARVLGETRKEELIVRIEWLLGDRQGPSPQPLESHRDQ